LPGTALCNVLPKLRIDQPQNLRFYADSTLKIFNDENGALIDSFTPIPKIKLLLQDHNGAPVIVNAKNQVKRLDQNDQWVTVASFEGGNLYRVIFNNDNQCYLITNKGIVDAATHTAYMPDKSLYHSESAYRGGESFQSIDDDISTYVDKDNNLWVYFGHGEWGSDMFIFNIKNAGFIPLSGWIEIPSYESNGHLFSLAQVFHDSYVIQYDKVYSANQVISMFKGKEVYKSSDDPSFPGGIKKDFDFFIEGYTFKNNDGCIYFITSKGLYKLNLSGHDLKFGNAAPIKAFILPKQTNKLYKFIDHQKITDIFRNSITPYITKLQFTSDQLVLLAPGNGIWLFDGKKLTALE